VRKLVNVKMLQLTLENGLGSARATIDGVTTWKFILPMPDNVANARVHWRDRSRLKKKYRARLDELQAAGLIPPPPAEPYARVTVRSLMRLGNAMDDDNAIARHKPILDWLKTRGYIADDRRKCLRWETFPEQIVRRNGDYTIELTLTPVTE
jgi:hypothetical protein